MSLRETLAARYRDIYVLLSKNKTVENIGRVIASPLFAYWQYKDNKAERMRREGYQDPRFLWIKDIKGKYEGKRCFVVGAGPSLTFEDLDAISGEYSFGVNGCILSFDRTRWRPTFYGVEDKHTWEALNAHILKHPELNVFAAGIIEGGFNLPDWVKLYPFNLLDHRFYHRKGYGKVLFSDDLYAAVYMTYSIVFSMLQFAVWMGFKEIYLLGCDCNYSQPKQHFIEYGHRNTIHSGEGERLLYVHAEFRKFADAHGVRVINCTRGGMLEAYPRMTLEDVLSQNIRENTLTAADNNAIIRTAEQPNSRTFHDLVFIFFADNRKFIPSSEFRSQGRGRNFSCSHRLEVAA